MKKILLCAAVAVSCVGSSMANTFTFLNFTGCTYTYHVAGIDPANPLGGFASTPITVPAGSISSPATLAFPVPSSLPGLPGLSGTVYYRYVRGWINATPGMSTNVGNFPAEGFPPSINVPPTNCQPQGNSVNFNGNSTGGNVVVLIF